MLQFIRDDIEQNDRPQLWKTAMRYEFCWFLTVHFIHITV